MFKDELGTRMKKYYEEVPKTKLMRRTPVIIRIDGKTFHSFTKKFQKPFDELLIKTMQETTKYLCENIQGCVLGYTQSDEISLLLVDYKRLNSSSWFDYEVQKMCSIAASMATMAFNKFFMFEFEEFDRWICDGSPTDGERQLYDVYYDAICKGAMFDARVFNIPKEEVTNYFLWRQFDAMRNSVQMVGQAHFSHKELQNKTGDVIQEMLLSQKKIDWSNLPLYQQRGSCCVKEEYWVDDKGFPSFLVYQGSGENANKRNRWIIDKNIPIFKGDGRDYIEKLIWVGDEQ